MWTFKAGASVHYSTSTSTSTSTVNEPRRAKTCGIKSISDHSTCTAMLGTVREATPDSGKKRSPGWAELTVGNPNDW